MSTLNFDPPFFSSCQRLFWMFRIILSLFIGAVIVGEFWILVWESFHAPVFLSLPAALNFTCDWAEARMTTKASYKSFSSAVVHVEVGLHVGLYGINVTLKGESLLFFRRCSFSILAN